MAYEEIYEPLTWKNEPSVETPINETNLNHIERGIDGLDKRSVALDARMRVIEEMEPQFVEWMTRAENAAEGAEESEGEAKTSELNAKDSENAAKQSEINAKASENAAKLSETLAAQSETNAKESENAAKVSETHAKTSEVQANASMQAAIAARDVATDARDEAVDAMNNADERADDSEAWAVGERKGVPVSETDETFENNSKWYAGRSRQSEANAAASAQEAEDALDDLEARIRDAFDESVPEAWIDFSTGLLMWNGGKFIFAVDNTTGDLLWSLA